MLTFLLACESNFTLRFIDTLTGESLVHPSKQSITNVGLQLNLTSSSCGIQLDTSILNGVYPVP